MKNKTILFGSVLVAALMLASVVLAKGPSFPKGNGVAFKYDKEIHGKSVGLCYKSAPDWQCQYDDVPTGEVKYYGQKYKLQATGLTPNHWYYIELVDKGSDCTSWNVLNDDRYSWFYGEADDNGDLYMTFPWQQTGKIYLEINVKNADWVALLNPSDYGNEDDDWIYTGQGWDYVLYAETTTPKGCTYSP